MVDTNDNTKDDSLGASNGYYRLNVQPDTPNNDHPNNPVISTPNNATPNNNGMNRNSSWSKQSNTEN